MYGFSGKPALATGAATGLHDAIAQRSADEGDALVLAGIDAVGLANAAERLRSPGGTAHGVVSDVSAPVGLPR